MKAEILKIAGDLKNNKITVEESQTLLMTLFKVEYTQDDLVDIALEGAAAIEDDAEKLRGYRDIAEDVANQFTYEMSKLISAIEEAPDEVSEEAKRETDYWDVADITNDIHPTKSWDW